jgi:hypothetical protein
MQINDLSILKPMILEAMFIALNIPNYYSLILVHQLKGNY